MSTPARLFRAGSRFSPQLRLLYHRSQAQVHRYDATLYRLNTPCVRHMGMFKEFSKRFKGELENNPELQKSIEQLKEKAGDLKHRTKETTQQIYKHVEGAEARAKQVSAVVKEKVNVARERVSEATAQVKESVSSFKSSNPQYPKSPSDASNGTSFTDTGRQEAAGESQSGRGSAANVFSKGFQIFSSSTAVLIDKVRGAKVVDLAKKGYGLLVEELTMTPSKRRVQASYTATTTAARSASTALVPVVKKRSGWEKRWDDLKDKVRAHPMYKRARGIKELPIVTKSQEIAEDVRERWETSDSPVVHKIQDLNDSLFGETASAVAVKEIRQRDPMFSFPDFLVEVQESTRPVLQAYLKGDLTELQKRCSREVVDRCRAERRAYESQGIFMDNKILHISDVELKETKLMGNTPIIIVAFQTQQIYCVRDKQGKITQGAKDDIHTVFYAWAMQQVVPEEIQEGAMYPYWQLREMQQLGIQSII